MWIGKNRDEFRALFVEAWRKHRANLPLEPIERVISGVVARHPEYHARLEAGAVERDYLPEAGETNPFLHMAMHIAIEEQVTTDRPAGIITIFQTLAAKSGPHDAEHLMMECLGRALWEAQRSGALPDESAYLECLRSLAS
jgi:hypothetical protein